MLLLMMMLIILFLTPIFHLYILLYTACSGQQFNLLTKIHVYSQLWRATFSLVQDRSKYDLIFIYFHNVLKGRSWHGIFFALLMGIYMGTCWGLPEQAGYIYIYK